jgi:hypothetical protein
MHLIHQLDDTLSNVTGQFDSNLLPIYASHSNLRFAIKTQLGSEREAPSARRRHVSIHDRPILPSGNGGNGGGGGGSGSGGNTSHPPTPLGPPSNHSPILNTGSGGPSSSAAKGGKGSRTPRGKGHSSTGPVPRPQFTPTARTLRRITLPPTLVLFVVCTLKAILRSTFALAPSSFATRSTISSAALVLNHPHLRCRTSCHHILTPQVLSNSSALSVHEMARTSVFLAPTGSPHGKYSHV